MNDARPGGQVLRARAARERERAERAAGIAARHEALLAAQESGSRLWLLFTEGVRLHRAAEAQHRMTEQLYHALADRRSAGDGGPPTWGAALLSAVGAVAGAGGAVLSVPAGRAADAVLASDARARRAHEVEFAAGEGPAHDCVVQGALTAAGPELRDRWPLYGREIGALGVGRVSAAPLAATAPAGSLVLFDAAPAVDAGHLPRVRALADALRHLAWTEPAPRSRSTTLTVGDFDHRPVLQQAAGLLSARLGCTADDAIALIRARAFAEGRDAAEVAGAVLDGTEWVAGLWRGGTT